ncbi:hypothetical protein B484DRAFT_448404, partial [Ochromonadaceae sp. CCMP2298]
MRSFKPVIWFFIALISCTLVDSAVGRGRRAKGRRNREQETRNSEQGTGKREKEQGTVRRDRRSWYIRGDEIDRAVTYGFLNRRCGCMTRH